MNLSERNQRAKLYLALGYLGLFAILGGFLKTFIVPVSEGSFQAPAIIYIHGLLATVWVLLFLIQSVLIRSNNFKIHKKLGYIGLLIAIAAGITIIPAGLQQVKRELDLGLGQTAISGIVGAITTAAIFLALVISGVRLRRNPAAHKRLMALGTIVLLWPAWFRFRHYFPSIPNPEIWFAVVLADSFIVVAMIWDRLVYKRIHPVFLIVGPLIILEHFVEMILFDSSPWRVVANFVYRLLVT